VRVVAASMEAVGEVTVSERKSKAAGPGADQALGSEEEEEEEVVVVVGEVWACAVWPLMPLEIGWESCLDSVMVGLSKPLVRGSVWCCISVIVRGLMPLILDSLSCLDSFIVWASVLLVADSVRSCTSAIIGVKREQISAERREKSWVILLKKGQHRCN